MGMSYELLYAGLAIQLPVIGACWYGFNAESRLVDSRKDDIRDAESGFKSGLIDPALTALIDEVIAVKKANEPVADALLRFDVNRHVEAVSTAAGKKDAARGFLSRLVTAWTVFAWTLVVVDVAAIAVSFNSVAKREVIDGAWPAVALIVLSASSAVMLVSAAYVRHVARALSRAVADGKDAGSAY